MSYIGQIIIKRESREVDEGTMGFHDYTTYKEDFLAFVNRVSSIANELENNRIINISYPSEDKAVICYTTTEFLAEEIDMSFKVDFSSVRTVNVHKDQFEAIDKKANVVIINCIEDGRCIAFNRADSEKDKIDRLNRNSKLNQTFDC